MTPNTPTLYSLLEVLASENVTSSDQRIQIRKVVADFLANDIPHSKLYGYIGQIIGHDVLHDIIDKLQTSGGNGKPLSSGIKAIDNAFNIGGVTKDMNHVTRIRSPQLLFNSAKWIALKEDMAPPPVYDHATVACTHRVFNFGGAAGSNDTSNRMAVVLSTNLHDLKFRNVKTYGDLPPSLRGHTAEQVICGSPDYTVTQVPLIYIVGGMLNDESYSNTVYSFNIGAKKWQIVPTLGPCPPARAYHSCWVYPLRSDETQTSSVNQKLIIAGGKGKREDGTETIMDDIWCLDIATSTWAKIATQPGVRPTPRFGACAGWVSEYMLVWHGGQTSEGQLQYILDDMWVLRLNEQDRSLLSGEWVEVNQEGIPPRRAFAATVFLSQEFQTARASVRLMMIISGLTSNEDQGAEGPGGFIEVCSVGVFAFDSATSTSGKWGEFDPPHQRDYSGPAFQPRRGHIALFFEMSQSVHNVKLTPVPCVYVHGGTNSQGKLTSDAWILSLSGVDPLASPVAATHAVKPSQDHDVFVPRHLQSVMSTTPAMEILSGAEYLRHVPMWVDRVTTAPSLLTTLATTCGWAFGAIGLLIDNSLGPLVGSTAIDVSYGRDGPDTLTIEDDGRGVDYMGMNRMLKKYGNSASDSYLSSNHGVGFKLAAARLGCSVLALSRTATTLGAGLLSLELLAQSDSQCTLAPICMWRLPSLERILTGFPMADIRHAMRLLLLHSPFKSAREFADRLNAVSRGTQLIIWTLREEMESVALDEGGIYLESAPGVAEREKRRVMNLDADAADREAALMDETVASKEPKDEIKVKVEDKVETSLSDDPPMAPYHLHEAFPFWDTAKYSIDYCLATYMYWLNLYSYSTAYSVNRTHLIPKDADANTNCIYRYLKTKMHKVVELPYLFDIIDSDQGAHGIIGFINEPGKPRTVAEGGILLYHNCRLIARWRAPLAAPPSVLNRIQDDESSPFPCTALINVPDWLKPNCSRTGFVHENSVVWRRFNQHLSVLIDDYLAEAASGDLKNWNLKKWKEFTDRRVEVKATRRNIERQEEEAKRRSVGSPTAREHNKISIFDSERRPRREKGAEEDLPPEEEDEEDDSISDEPMPQDDAPEQGEEEPDEES